MEMDLDQLRLIIFSGLLLVFLSVENLNPFRARKLARGKHYATNLGLSVINSLLLKLLLPVGAIGAAFFAKQWGYGLFNLVDFPFLVEVLICFLLLDCAIYFQHRVFHAVPVLWKLHRVHHSDVDFDVTTGLRFHPLEILISMLIKMLLVFLLGAPIVSVLIFEIVLNSGALFTHSNFRLPLAVDKVIRLLLVTPSVHRTHHSVFRKETDSNFGFNLIIWDKLFGTYIAQAQHPEQTMEIGLDKFNSDSEQGFLALLWQPFLKNK